MSIKVGHVVSVKGTDIIIQMDEDSNKVLYRYDGDLYHGVAIRECLSIRTGIYNIICKVEGEYLDENSYSENKQEKKVYLRKVFAKPIGYKENNVFYEGNKYLPMIKDSVYLMTNVELSSVYNPNIEDGYIIGKTLKDDIPYKANYNNLFNKHIGVFGNTGSGKSNTLTKIYTELFAKYKEKIKGNSQFLLFDFNGEYTGKQLLDDDNDKKVCNLNTMSKEDTITISPDCFWDTDILGLMFKATYNTQRPFIKRLVDGRKRFLDRGNSLSNYYDYSVDNFLSSSNPKKEVKELFLSIVDILVNITAEAERTDILAAKSSFEGLTWHGSNSYYYSDNDSRNNINNPQIITRISGSMKNVIDESCLENTDELLVRAYLQLINDLLKGYVQFEHINPLLNRIKALKNNIENVISLSDQDTDADIMLRVISFRKCNQDIKKILPLIIAKSYYEKHKMHSDSGLITKTLHFIIDEAHNILSYDSSREEESWKDYRLDLFEEIIKEGRKFGVFMTISSQRPADISHTIMSQFHNFFIHRLVNDKDLALIDNAISSLDKVSKGNIPTLPTGACIITGTSFIIPLTIQIDRIEDEEQRPDSEDVDLKTLWGLAE